MKLSNEVMEMILNEQIPARLVAMYLEEKMGKDQFMKFVGETIRLIYKLGEK